MRQAILVHFMQRVTTADGQLAAYLTPEVVIHSIHPGSSCDLALRGLQGAIKRAAEAKCSIVVLFLNVRNAYRSIPFHLIFRALCMYGISVDASALVSYATRFWRDSLEGEDPCPPW